eukprot:80902-Pleurochrysis_carterae.AAC.1
MQRRRSAGARGGGAGVGARGGDVRAGACDVGVMGADATVAGAGAEASAGAGTGTDAGIATGSADAGADKANGSVAGAGALLHTPSAARQRSPALRAYGRPRAAGWAACARPRTLPATDEGDTSTVHRYGRGATSRC